MEEVLFVMNFDLQFRELLRIRLLRDPYH
jgi:hypothetical protein